MDVFDTGKRSVVMGRVKGKDTKPEWRVRSYLHACGLRYRLHDRKLPGAPDLVFPARRVAVFVHGCFWHGHQGCRKASIPKTRPDFWRDKINENRARDRRNLELLEKAGWRVITIWECEIDEGALNQLAHAIYAEAPK